MIFDRHVISNTSMKTGISGSATMGDSRVGSPANVSYNPENPAEAYITNNIGKANV